MKNYISNIGKSKLILGMCILGILILGMYQLFNKNSVRLYLEEIENSNIDYVIIVVDKFYDYKIKLDNTDLIDQLREDITKFEWSISNQNSYKGDGNTLYNFEMSTKDGNINFSLIGKNYVLIDYFDQNQKNYKYINLEVAWDEESYNRITDLVKESRELQKNK